MNSANTTHRQCAHCGKTITLSDSVRYTATRGVWHDTCWRKNGGRRK